ncbi:methionine adenosyltransferase domain-containing protein [Mediterraneibacter gnavus]|uniref:methionine adenosyltransferase domain-containing protein n=1 Tax=Mediterraneibacter gnavus TaxID=33038 RepID=UPI0036D379A1
MLAFSNDYYGMIFRATQSVELFCAYFGTGELPEDMLIHIIRDNFDLSPTGIIKMLDLRQPIYKQVSAYGHFGRLDLDLPWERLDKVEDLKKYKNDTEKGTD